MSERSTELRGPADAAFIRLARTATLSVASTRGFAVDACDELRMAVEEACNALTSGGAKELTITYVDDRAGLTLSIQPAPEQDVTLTSTAELILTTMCDRLSITSGGALVIVKNLQS